MEWRQSTTWANAPSRAVKTLIVGIALRWLGISIYTPYLLAYIHDSLGLTFLAAGLIVGAIGLVVLPLPLAGGGICDRFGRRRLIVLSLGGEALGLGLLVWGIDVGSLALAFGALLLSRASFSFGNPATSAYIADAADGGTRATAYAWSRVGLNVGFAGGVALGGALLATFTYGQVVALGALIVSGGVALNALFLTPSTRDRLLARGTGSPRTLGGQGAFREVGRSMVASVHSLRRDRKLLLIWFAFTPLWMMVNQLGYALSTFALVDLRISYGVLGLALAINGLIPVLTQVPLTRGLSGRHLTGVGIGGAAAYAIAFAGLGLVGLFPTTAVATFIAMVVVMTFGENLVLIPASTLPQNIASEDSRGAYAGAIATAGGVGGILAPMIAGLALSSAGTPLIAWGILLTPAMPAIVILTYLGRRSPPSQNPV